jgi:hypothetical protein
VMRSDPPNPRVQRTRVARCARPASPLTRHPSGRQVSSQLHGGDGCLSI